MATDLSLAANPNGINLSNTSDAGTADSNDDYLQSKLSAALDTATKLKGSPLSNEESLGVWHNVLTGGNAIPTSAAPSVPDVPAITPPIDTYGPKQPPAMPDALNLPPGATINTPSFLTQLLRKSIASSASAFPGEASGANNAPMEPYSSSTQDVPLPPDQQAAKDKAGKAALGVLGTIGAIAAPEVALPLAAISKVGYDVSQDPAVNQAVSNYKAQLTGPESYLNVGPVAGTATAKAIGDVGGVGGTLLNALTSALSPVLGTIGQGIKGVQTAVSPLADTGVGRILGAIAGASSNNQSSKLIGSLIDPNNPNLVPTSSDYLQNEPSPLADIDRQAQSIMAINPAIRTEGQNAFLNNYGANREQIATSALKVAPIFNPQMPEAQQNNAVNYINGYHDINDKGGIQDQIDAAIDSKDPALILAAMKKIDDVGQRALGARALSAQGAESLGSLEAIIGPSAAVPGGSPVLTQTQQERLRDPATWSTLRNTARALSSDLLTNLGGLQKTFGGMDRVLARNGLVTTPTGDVQPSILSTAGQTSSPIAINPADTANQEKLDKADVASSYIGSIIQTAQTGGNVGGKVDALLTAFPFLKPVADAIGYKVGSGSSIASQNIDDLIHNYYTLQPLQDQYNDAKVRLAANPNDTGLQNAVQTASTNLTAAQTAAAKAITPGSKAAPAGKGGTKPPKTPPANVKHF